MKKLLLIINPVTARSAVTPALIDVLDCFEKGGYAATVHITQSKNDTFDTVKRVGRDYDVVVCAGGDGTLNETLCGLSFKLSPASFFQVNPVMTEPLYETAVDFAALTGTETVIDAYCGTGTIGLIAAGHAGQVIGAELSADAVRDARENAKANNIKNARFVRADSGRFMTERAAKGETVDVVFLDPPRSGCSPAFLNALLSLAPGRIVYISCGPESLARDLAVLTKSAYRAEAIQPFDLFPFTEHCEVAVQLCRNSSSHSMNLQNEPFEMIKNGQKTI